jgi:tetratricopeptide (TPR) repeat protein
MLASRRQLKTNPNDDFLRSLRAARWRLRTQLFLESFVSIALAAGLVLMIAAAVQRWLLDGATLDALWWWGALAFVAVSALLAAGCRRLGLKEIAILVDRLGGTRDRFLTALSFADSASDFENLAVHECRAFLAKGNFARDVPVRLPFATRYLLVPAIALALLQWEARLAEDKRRRAAEAAQQEVGGTTSQLEQLAKEIEKANDKAGDEELKKIAEQLKKSAEQLRAQNNGADEAAKAALRELSNLEQMLQQLQKPPAAATPEEMKQLAKSLAQNPATEKAAEALQAGQLAEAAKELEEAAKQEPTKEEAEKTLREALERLAAQRQLSEALQQLAKQAQQQSGESSETLQKLAQMLKQMGRQQQGGAGQQGKPMTEEMLKKLLAALENMKFGKARNLEEIRTRKAAREARSASNPLPNPIRAVRRIPVGSSFRAVSRAARRTPARPKRLSARNPANAESRARTNRSRAASAKANHFPNFSRRPATPRNRSVVTRNSTKPWRPRPRKPSSRKTFRLARASSSSVTSRASDPKNNHDRSPTSRRARRPIQDDLPTHSQRDGKNDGRPGGDSRRGARGLLRRRTRASRRACPASAKRCSCARSPRRSISLSPACSSRRT